MVTVGYGWLSQNELVIKLELKLLRGLSSSYSRVKLELVGARVSWNQVSKAKTRAGTNLRLVKLGLMLYLWLSFTSGSSPNELELIIELELEHSLSFEVLL